jgi:hypothetical protein
MNPCADWIREFPTWYDWFQNFFGYDSYSIYADSDSDSDSDGDGDSDDEHMDRWDDDWDPFFTLKFTADEALQLLDEYFRSDNPDTYQSLRPSSRNFRVSLLYGHISTTLNSKDDNHKGTCG